MIFVYVFLAALLCVILWSDGPRTKSGPRIKSMQNLADIGHAIRNYSEKKSSRPQRLSDLVPKYIPLSNMALFYVTNSFANRAALPPDWTSNRSRIDEYGAYVYVGTNSQEEVLAFERSDLWKSNSSLPGKTAVLFADGHVQMIESSRLPEVIGAAPLSHLPDDGERQPKH